MQYTAENINLAYLGATVAGAAAGAALGAGFGTLIGGPLGAAIGGVIGGCVGGWFGAHGFKTYLLWEDEENSLCYNIGNQLFVPVIGVTTGSLAGVLYMMGTMLAASAVSVPGIGLIAAAGAAVPTVPNLMGSLFGKAFSFFTSEHKENLSKDERRQALENSWLYTSP